MLAIHLQAASDVNSPVSGEVSAVNDSLTDESSMVCPSPKSLAGFSICSLTKGIYCVYVCVFMLSLLASGLVFNSSNMSCINMFMCIFQSCALHHDIWTVIHSNHCYMVDKSAYHDMVLIENH